MLFHERCSLSRVLPRNVFVRFSRCWHLTPAQSTCVDLLIKHWLNACDAYIVSQSYVSHFYNFLREWILCQMVREERQERFSLQGTFVMMIWLMINKQSNQWTKEFWTKEIASTEAPHKFFLRSHFLKELLNTGECSLTRGQGSKEQSDHVGFVGHGFWNLF